MTPPPPHPALATRRSRFRRIRQSVLATAVALFVAVFSTIYLQMLLGKDPALSSGSSTQQSEGTAMASTATVTDDDDDEGDDDDDDDDGGSSAVTTQQS